MGQKTIMRLSSDIGQTTFNKMITEANPSKCGAVDYYLYQFTDGTYQLGGYAWSDFIEEEDMSLSGDPLENEILIKFGYGYHNTKYGRLIIEQNLGSIEEFMRLAKEQIPIYILKKFSHNPLRIMDIRSDIKEFLKEWMEPFLYMDDTFHLLLDDLYKISKPNFIRPLSYEEFTRYVQMALDQSLFGKVKYTRYEDELRISV